MFIVFEGIDGCGKTTLSKKLCNYFAENEPHKKWFWTKEPTFSSEEADVLNSKEMKNQYARERLFFEDRINHQKELEHYRNIVCDRYIMSGLAYASVFAPLTFEMIKELYLNTKIFRQPDLQIFVDTPIETCLERRKEDVKEENLKLLRNKYLEIINLYNNSSKIYVFNPVEGEKESFNKLIREI